MSTSFLVETGKLVNNPSGFVSIRDIDQFICLATDGCGSIGSASGRATDFCPSGPGLIPGSNMAFLAGCLYSHWELGFYSYKNES